MVNKKRLIGLLQQLIAVDSQNPPGDEKEIALFIKRYLKNAGIDSRIIEFKKRRSNLLALIKGRRGRHTLLVTPHLDTVPEGRNWREGAFSGKIRGDKIYGLGATDCKSNIACCIEALNSLVEEKVFLDYNLIFAATADEETGSDLGLVPLLRRKILQADAAVVLDSDDFEVIVAQKGLVHLKVKVSGKRAHGAYPWRGKNAIAAAVGMLAGVKSYAFKYRRANPYLRPPTVNIGTIHGGDKVNIVADWCEFELDFRYLPGMSAGEILRDLKKILSRNGCGYKIEIEGIQKPYVIEDSHPLVRSLASAMRRAGIRPRLKGSEGATTITFFQDAGIPAVATGFGRDGCAHTPDEYARVSTLYKGAQVLEDFFKNYQG